MSWLIILVIIVVVIAIKMKEKEELENTVIHIDNKERPIDPNESFKGRCRAKRIFTNNEWRAYKRLKSICDKHYLVICPKVRLLDIVEPIPNDPKKLLLMNKIKAKHVDFVICDLNMNIYGVVELDDLTHDAPDRIIRDQFVDEILLDVGYIVIHTRYINENTLDPIIARAGT